MATATQIATFLSKSPSSFHFYTRFYSLPTTSSFSPIFTTSRKSILLQTNSKLLPLPVAAAAAVDSAVDATEQLVSATVDAAATVDSAVDATEKLASTPVDSGSVIVSALFFLAFVGLSAITIGVIYLAVTDFLTKREKDKFEKEEAKTEKKKKKKKKVFMRAAPKGFGQKAVEIDDDD